MDCSQIREAFLSHTAARNAAVEAHLRDCPQCRELFEQNAALGHSLANASAQATPFPEHLFGELQASLAQETGLRAWLRSRPTRLRYAAAVWSILLVVTLFGLLRERPDFAEYPRLRFALLFGGYLIGILLALGKELSVSARRGPLANQLALSVGALGLPFLIAFAPATEASRHAGPGGALSCFMYGALLTLPTAVLLWAFDRDDRPSLRTVCSAAIALGFAANLVLELHCPSGNALHLLLGHATIGIAWLAVWLAVRRTSRA